MTISRQNRVWNSVKEWIQVIIIALMISLPIRFFIAEPFIVNGASMDPTFSTGQFLIVDRITYRFGNPSRGDVIVFKYPNDPKIYYIKRIVGLPGETLTMTDGSIVVTKPEDPIFTEQYPKGLTLDESYIAQVHRSHDTMTTTLGENNFFVMGDNRLQSSDSRAWGTLDRSLIVGRPIIRLLPPSALSVWPGKESQ